MDAYSRDIATSYGLTLVAGMPLPAALTDAVVRRQRAVERAAPGRFRWYGADYLHVTLAAPLRSRYRDAPAIRRAELPPDFGQFLTGLVEVCAELSPFELTLGDCRLHRDTVSTDVAGGHGQATRLRALLSCCDGFDPPKHPEGGLHLSCGFLVPGGESELPEAVVTPGLTDWVSASASIDSLALVHYSNRTLASVVGAVRLPLGRERPLAEAAVLQQLGIAS